MNPGVLVPINESLAKIKNDTIISLFDLKDSFHQVKLSANKDESGFCIRDLFSFHSYVPGKQYCRSTRAVMGAASSTSNSSQAFKAINETINLTPIEFSVDEFKKMIEGDGVQSAKEEPKAPGQTWRAGAMELWRVRGVPPPPGLTIDRVR